MVKKKKKKSLNIQQKRGNRPAKFWVSPRGSLIDTNTFKKKKYIYIKKKKNTAGHALRHNMEIGVKNGMDG